MARQKNTIAIAAPAEAVAAYLRDPTKMPEWLPSLVEVRDVVGRGVGQTFTWTYEMFGLPFEGHTKVVEHQPRRSVHESTGGIESKWTTTLVPQNGETELTMEIEYSIPLPVLGAIAEKLTLKRNARELAEALHNVKSIVED